jgi:hypothetical protein
MANNENYEPMQVDANEENDNDEDLGGGVPPLVIHHDGGGGVAANGGYQIGGPGLAVQVSAGNYQRGEVYGEDSRVCYNIENPTIDLEAYGQGYTGLACLYRLRFIAHHCPVLRVEALKLAIAHVMNTHNTALYSELHKKLILAMGEQNSQQSAASNLPDVAAAATGAASSNGGVDRSSPATVGTAATVRDWIEVRNKKAALKLEKLDTDLKNYKSNSIKVKKNSYPIKTFCMSN